MKHRWGVPALITIYKYVVIGFIAYWLGLSLSWCYNFVFINVFSWPFSPLPCRVVYPHINYTKLASSQHPLAESWMNRVPTLLPCSAECVIHSNAFNVPLEAISSVRAFSTKCDVSGSNAEVGSAEFPNQSKFPDNRRGRSPSNRRISAALRDRAITSSILCASPPLRLDHSRCHRSESKPHTCASSELRLITSASALFRARARWVPKDRMECMKSVGVPGKREGLWGTYMTRVL